MANDDALLKHCLTKYKHPEHTAREVVSCIQHYKSLSYRMEKFVFNNGSRKDLLDLIGTIPVGFKGTIYNIPVAIWLMDTHPYNAPLCFVKPTADMSIKVSKYVDSNGKIYLPYLHEWNSNSSSLLGLIQCMIIAFGELPPVYAKPSYPIINVMPNDMTEPPKFSDHIPLPYPAASNVPYPTFGTPYPGYSAANGMPYPHPPIPPVMPGPPFGGTQDAASGTITEEHIKASLLSAVEDKLRRKLNEQSQQSTAELETLRRTQQELHEGQTRLEDILSRLQRERSDLDKNITILQEKQNELQSALNRLSEHEGVDVDEAVVTTAPLYSQLLNAFAEEATLEDAIYYMGEALRKEVIDLDTFLKQVRTLARRQFILRALMHKCRQKAQLAC